MLLLPPSSYVCEPTSLHSSLAADGCSVCAGPLRCPHSDPITEVFLQARDAGGTICANLAPYVTNVYCAARLRKGLPIPMKCTYNGLAVVNAAPFRLHSLRFRQACPSGQHCSSNLLLPVLGACCSLQAPLQFCLLPKSRVKLGRAVVSKSIPKA